MNAMARVLSDVLPISHAEPFGWYVVYTNINCELRAKMGLDVLGYRTFLPMATKWLWLKGPRGGSRKREKVRRPLFPRYLFVGVDTDRQPWYPIRRTNGVECVLCNDEIPERIPEPLIDRLIRDEDSGVYDKTREHLYAPGDQVQVEGGPFGQFAAEVARADDGKTVEILLDMLGRKSRMRVELARVCLK